MKIFSTNDIRTLDEYTIEHEPISHIDLMERVASAMSLEILSRWPRSTRLYVFAGPGNNGGDALAVARILCDHGYAPIVYLFNTCPEKGLSPCTQTNKERLMECESLQFTEIKDEFIPPQLTDSDLVIDGLFGAGLNKPLSGGFVSLVRLINDSGAQVVSIDIPSGLFGENNLENNPRDIIRAVLTLSIQFPKLAFLMSENARYVGEFKIIDAGLHPDILEERPSPYSLVERCDVSQLLPVRTRFSDKRDYGHVLLIAGQYGMMGAAVLSARAVMHAGAGLVTVHAPRCGYDILQTAVPEALFEPDKNETQLTEILIKRRYQAIAVGPGIGCNDASIKALADLLRQLRYPAVFDADALNCIAKKPDLLAQLPAYSVITPHVKEFDRMFGIHATDYQRLEEAVEVARRYKLVVVLKGAYTATVLPEGNVFFNSSGNSGMATAGSGDVLTGVITGLMAQGLSAPQAAVTGVFLHGMAGDLAAENESEEFITANDIINYLGKAYRQIK
ncbi:NAD(P)H-hydrate dehydratase [Barnesiella propionica]|uniref:NAD(P)H-hydrate dehydratase n=1 Tax=Barnesiella propionica TaxID=2981781 RepID=UPI0011C71211|nr:NAD(P)H-hydrate dehydratase [Barnesiella propionica]MCU6768554.1 NAD(P)H-hydrate dehydratase [Barnesiella propionica]